MGVSVGTAAAISAGGSVHGAGIGALGSKSAGSQASAADQQAAQIQQQEMAQERQDLLPYNTAGQAMLPQLAAFPGMAATALTNQFNTVQAATPKPMTEQNLVQTPGYQFNLSQGLKATQNSAAARGLGVSGAAMKGAATYATGLADSTYQNQFGNEQTLFGDANQQYANTVNGLNAQFSYMMPQAQLGENAAAMSGMQGTAGAANAGNSLIASGGAQAAGTVGATNAATSGLGNLGSIATNLAATNKLFNNDGGATQDVGTSSTYTNPADGSSYQSSSSPADNF